MPAADNVFASGFAAHSEVGTGSTEVPAATMTVTQPTPSRSSTQETDSVGTTGLTASAPASPGSPAPQTVKPSSDRISTRTRGRTETASGNAPPAVDYGFGPGGAPRPSAGRATTPPRVPRPQPAPPTAATPAPAASSVPTVPLPSDRGSGGATSCVRHKRSPAPNNAPVVPGELTLCRTNPHPAVKAVGRAKRSTTKSRLAGPTAGRW